MGPVVLLVIAVDSEILFQSLVSAFGLSIALRVVTRGEVQFHVQDFSEEMEKGQDKL